jgi:hypothetical protein
VHKICFLTLSSLLGCPFIHQWLYSASKDLWPPHTRKVSQSISTLGRTRLDE